LKVLNYFRHRWPVLWGKVELELKYLEGRDDDQELLVLVLEKLTSIWSNEKQRINW
jgi:hypothetical protein